MKPNIDFFEHHIDIAKWRFVVLLAGSLVALYLTRLITNYQDLPTSSAAISGSVVTGYGACLVFQLFRHPRKNRYWVLIKHPKEWVEVGGPYSKDHANEIYFNTLEILDKDEDLPDGVFDVFMIQSKNEETALEEAHEMLRSKEDVKTT